MKIISNHDSDVMALLAVHGCGGRLDIVRGPRLDFDETEHVSVPPDEINFPMMSCAAEVACDHDVTATSQVEVCVFLAAPSGAKMSGGSLRACVFRGNPI